MQIDYDVIIVGGGGSGLAAAIEAAEAGCKVLLLEKAPRLGGTTAWSIGSISATGTPHQAAAGIVDSPQGHYEDIPKFASHLQAEDNPALRRMLTDNVPNTFRWLISLGVHFFGPMPEPPHRHPRMHNVVPSARAYIAACERKARKLSVKIRVGAHVHRLLVDDERVTGVVAKVGEGATMSIRASAVVLACGDYSGSAELKRRFISEDAARMIPVNTFSTGDGHVMGLEVGARVLNGHLAHTGSRFIPPQRRSLVRALPNLRAVGWFAKFALDNLPAWMVRPMVMGLLLTVMEPSSKLYDEGAILVGADGNLIAEAGDDRVKNLAATPHQRGFILIDGRIAKMFSQWPYYISTAPGIAYAYLPDYLHSRRDVTVRGETLKDAARLAGVDGQSLENTVKTVNARRQNAGSDLKLSGGPFYLLGPVQLYMTFTDGGLAVDAQLRVLGTGESPIGGLYAAGSNGQGGLLLEGHGHHIGWAFTSGRIAGRNAAMEAKSA